MASVLVDKLPPCPNLFQTHSVRLEIFIKIRFQTESKFTLHTVSEDFVYKELCMLNSAKSAGIDNIPARFLKDGASFLKIPITFIVNKSIVENRVPVELKAVRVKPLHKKNSKTDVGNYRPVSILCIVFKILERAVYNQLETYLVKNHLLYEFQSEFRTNFLVFLADYIRAQTAKGLYTGMILLDLQKAFDTVNHSILCSKLKAMGVESVEWFSSGRNQQVHVNGTLSSSESITCGVPQGSILGPLLFLCYVNDMAISISTECKLLLYADDSAIIFSHKCLEEISRKLGLELENCNKWLIDNKLSLHLGLLIRDFGHHRTGNQTGHLIKSFHRCLGQKSLTTSVLQKNTSGLKRTSVLQTHTLANVLGSSQSGSLLKVCLPFVNSVRTVVKYSIRKGKPKTVRAVTQRFFRLPWGIYIRARAGRHKRKWAKPDWINERGKYHVFCNKQQSRMLDKMTCQYWKKRRYYVDDPYEPYMQRTGIDYTPPKFLP